jgi:sarcosine oxidase subunit alpha
MSHPHRIESGGLVDRSVPLAFRFDGRGFTGFMGDTLASALLANGVKLVGRSFKYHRPRGLLTAGPEEPNGLVELRTGAYREPNTRATTVEIYSGLEAFSQNRWPSLEWDILSVNDLFAPLLTAGFYYKTFMWPASFWERVYEPLIRRAAGLGRASALTDPDKYEKMHSFCDVLIVGGGPAGLAAAMAAARSGARIILCEDDFRLGGRLLSEKCTVAEMDGAIWAARSEAELAAMPGVTILKRTTVFGAYDGGVFGAIERLADHLAVPPARQSRQRYWKIRTRHVIFATGAIERPLVFGGNDRPGVMTASAVRTYIRRYAVAPGECAAVFTTTDDGWRTVDDLFSSGVEVAAVIDPRASVHPSLVAAGHRCGATVMLGAQVIGTRGRRSLDRITVRESSGKMTSFDVDLLAVSGGWNPQFALTTHLGTKARWSPQIFASVPGDLPRSMTVAGAAGGNFGLAGCLSEGTKAGSQAAQLTGTREQVAVIAPSADDEPCGLSPLWRVQDGHGKAFIDFQNDVTSNDIEIAVREGYRSVEHVKRYTTLGMATDQGKTSNANGNALSAELTQRSMADVGSTSLRPPYSPVAIGALANEHRGTCFAPMRLTAGHDWAAEHGAVFLDVGNWRRAQYFPIAGETSWVQAMEREVRTVRSAVGVCDVSTLGKIDIQGPGAAELLDLVYTNVFSTLPIGRVRYGLMLAEDGFVMDDGATARFAAHRYLMSTTTMNAALVMRHLDYCRQVLRPDLDVQITSVTEQWAQYSIAGPRSRDLLQSLFGDSFDFSNESFPYMAAAEVRFGEFTARIFRLSFSGELSYEVAVPAAFGDSLIRAIETAGAPFGIAPYGLEALGTMRLEKGHIGGAELNGRTTAPDLGLGRLVSAKKDCIGRILASRPGLTDPDRPVLVGLQSAVPGNPFLSGALLLMKDQEVQPPGEGYVTSAGFSPTLDRWIGLGLLRRGASRSGQMLRAYDPVRNSDTEVEVCSAHFFDPEGARLRV